ncbi:hypothetical protein Q7P37_010735 [Cladosporium fusiforme]
MAPAMESWDDDDDLQGDFQTFGNSVGTGAGSLSSRLSIRSESVAGDDDWNLVLQPNDEQSTSNALQSAKQAGIPLPADVPSSALLGGTIKRLGKKTTRQKVEDDWDNDMDLGDTPLTLKPRPAEPPAGFDDDADFDDFEGSLGIRFAGTTRDARESSVSGMSPSVGSPMVEESDHDDAGGLDIPDGPLDFDAILKKRRAAEAELSEASLPSVPPSQASPAIEQPSTLNSHKKSKLLAEVNEDFLEGFDFGGLKSLNVQKRTVNKNVKVKDAKPSPQSQRHATTLNFHDKPIDRPAHMRSHIPRPVSGSKPHPSRLEPVLENGTSTITRERRQQVASGNSSLLRNKRSAPALRSQAAQQSSVPRPPVPFLSAGSSSLQPTHASAQRAMPYHLRRDSDPNNRRGAQSPPLRSHSRLSNAYNPDTPSRLARPRADLAPAALAREAASKRNLTKPSRRRNFGDGSELDNFDDLRTNNEKESKYVKQPIARGPPRAGLKHAYSRSDIKEPTKKMVAIPDRMLTPGPPRTPASPTRGFGDVHNNTPSYLRDTAASRIARESRLASTNPRPRSEGPLMSVSTNWKAQVAARSPHTSPSAQKQKPKKAQPQLIQGMGITIAKTEKGMTYNPQTLRWEGNENTLTHFDIPPPLETPTPTSNHPHTSYMDQMDQPNLLPPPSASPPRPALIAPMSAATNMQVNGGMVFDPHLMKWLKIKNGRDVSGQMSPSVTDEEEDVFAGLEDLKENTPNFGNGASTTGMQSPVSMANAGMGEVHEEFDLGPRFIHTQRDEEVTWRRRCESWFPTRGGPRVEDEGWRWAVRDVLKQQQSLAL